MSLFDKVDTGLKIRRARHDFITTAQFDARFGEAIPIFAQYANPGDIWKVIVNMFIRFQPMLSPSLTRIWARMRFFFVSIRQVTPDFESVLTGSKNGKLIEGTLPVCKGIFDDLASGVAANVQKYSFMDYAFGADIKDYSAFKTDEFLPAQYWLNGFWRCWFDYYRDENLDSEDDFDTMMATKNADNSAGLADKLPFVKLRKDYFSGALPWQLKGVAPTFSVNPIADFSAAVAGVTHILSSGDTNGRIIAVNSNKTLQTDTVANGGNGGVYNQDLIEALNKVKISGGDFNMADLRDMAAQTRVFERSARCGSRFTEFLHANFGIAPLDETLQRAVYLGGFTQPVVTTEVVQTAADGSNPVGTLRGHGISNANGKIKPYVVKEPGMIFGIFDIMPEIQRTSGINRQYSYKRRFDFPNPSFQHLSEQEIRNGEVFVGADGKNDDTFGFTEMYNELRYGVKKICGDMRDGLKYWNQAISFSARPNLNKQFVDSKEYLSNFNQPFTVVSDSSRPIIVDMAAKCLTVRNLDKTGTPGSADHM